MYIIICSSNYRCTCCIQMSMGMYTLHLVILMLLILLTLSVDLKQHRTTLATYNYKYKARAGAEHTHTYAHTQLISKWLRSCNDCMLFGIIWRRWSRPFFKLWMFGIRPNTIDMWDWAFWNINYNYKQE